MNESECQKKKENLSEYQKNKENLSKARDNVIETNESTYESMFITCHVT